VPQYGLARAKICRLGYARQLDGNGGVRVAWAWRLCLTCLTSLTSLTRGRAIVYPEGLLAAVWYGSGKDLPLGVMQRADLPLGYARQLDGNGGVRGAGAWRLHKTYKTYKTYKMMMGAPCDTPWVCMPQFGMARAKMCRKGNVTGRFTAGVCFACLMATVVCVLRGRGACV